MNICILSGHAGADAEMKTTGTGKQVTTFKLATKGYKDTEWTTIVVWNNGNYKLAEYCAKDIKKGKFCVVVGKKKTRSYEDTDGNKRYITELIADAVEYEKSTQNKGENRQSDMSETGEQIPF